MKKNESMMEEEDEEEVKPKRQETSVSAVRNILDKDNKFSSDKNKIDKIDEKIVKSYPKAN